MIWRNRRKDARDTAPDEPRPTPATQRSLADLEAAAWPFTKDSPVVHDVLAQGGDVRILLADAIGLDWSEIAPLLPVACDVASEQGLVMVLLVDLVEFSGLRATEIAYDAVPNAAANARLAPDLDWAAYVVWRRKLAHDKWQPAATVNLGAGG
jgi:hypothetical protein